jgi:dihydroneopterin aldolase
MIYSVYLKNVRFFAYHGLYPEEAVKGNTFEVNLIIRYSNLERILSIEDTIDYVAVFEIVKRQMDIRRALIENLIESILDELKASFPAIVEIEIDIQKLNPPVEGLNGGVGVAIRHYYG